MQSWPPFWEGDFPSTCGCRRHRFDLACSCHLCREPRQRRHGGPARANSRQIAAVTRDEGPDLPDETSVIRQIDVMDSPAETHLCKSYRQLLKRPGCAYRHRDAGKSSFDRGGIPEIDNSPGRDHQFTIRVAPQILCQQAAEMPSATYDQDPLAARH